MSFEIRHVTLRYFIVVTLLRYVVTLLRNFIVVTAELVK